MINAMKLRHRQVCQKQNKTKTNKTQLQRVQISEDLPTALVILDIQRGDKYTGSVSFLERKILQYQRPLKSTSPSVMNLADIRYLNIKEEITSSIFPILSLLLLLLFFFLFLLKVSFFCYFLTSLINRGVHKSRLQILSGIKLYTRQAFLFLLNFKTNQFLQTQKAHHYLVHPIPACTQSPHSAL